MFLSQPTTFDGLFLRRWNDLCYFFSFTKNNTQQWYAALVAQVCLTSPFLRLDACYVIDESDTMVVSYPSIPHSSKTINQWVISQVSSTSSPVFSRTVYISHAKGTVAMVHWILVPVDATKETPNTSLVKLSRCPGCSLNNPKCTWSTKA